MQSGYESILSAQESQQQKALQAQAEQQEMERLTKEYGLKGGLQTQAELAALKQQAEQYGYESTLQAGRIGSQEKIASEQIAGNVTIQNLSDQAAMARTKEDNQSKVELQKLADAAAMLRLQAEQEGDTELQADALAAERQWRSEANALEEKLTMAKIGSEEKMQSLSEAAEMARLKENNQAAKDLQSLADQAAMLRLEAEQTGDVQMQQSALAAETQWRNEANALTREVEQLRVTAAEKELASQQAFESGEAEKARTFESGEAAVERAYRSLEREDIQLFEQENQEAARTFDAQQTQEKLAHEKDMASLTAALDLGNQSQIMALKGQIDSRLMGEEYRLQDLARQAQHTNDMELQTYVSGVQKDIEQMRLDSTEMITQWEIAEAQRQQTSAQSHETGILEKEWAYKALEREDLQEFNVENREDTQAFDASQAQAQMDHEADMTKLDRALELGNQTEVMGLQEQIDGRLMQQKAQLDELLLKAEQTGDMRLQQYVTEQSMIIDREQMALTEKVESARITEAQRQQASQQQFESGEAEKERTFQALEREDLQAFEAANREDVQAFDSAQAETQRLHEADMLELDRALEVGNQTDIMNLQSQIDERLMKSKADLDALARQAEFTNDMALQQYVTEQSMLIDREQMALTEKVESARITEAQRAQTSEQQFAAGEAEKEREYETLKQEDLQAFEAANREDIQKFDAEQAVFVQAHEENMTKLASALELNNQSEILQLQTAMERDLMNEESRLEELASQADFSRDQAMQAYVSDRQQAIEQMRLDMQKQLAVLETTTQKEVAAEGRASQERIASSQIASQEWQAQLDSDTRLELQDKAGQWDERIAQLNLEGDAKQSFLDGFMTFGQQYLTDKQDLLTSTSFDSEESRAEAIKSLTDTYMNQMDLFIAIEENGISPATPPTGEPGEEPTGGATDVQGIINQFQTSETNEPEAPMTGNALFDSTEKISSVDFTKYVVQELNSGNDDPRLTQIPPQELINRSYAIDPGTGMTFSQWLDAVLRYQPPADTSGGGGP
ncbi:hypothetical protein LDC_2491 [sediment metagenome]|uniref:Uncharacterized protein n=1 Tax=sediment metagenome TaxID=749907 RepID=D9PLR8_9ZZZZ